MKRMTSANYAKAFCVIITCVFLQYPPFCTAQLGEEAGMVVRLLVGGEAVETSVLRAGMTRMIEAEAATEVEGFMVGRGGRMMSMADRMGSSWKSILEVMPSSTPGKMLYKIHAPEDLSALYRMHYTPVELPVKRVSSISQIATINKVGISPGYIEDVNLFSFHKPEELWQTERLYCEYQGMVIEKVHPLRSGVETQLKSLVDADSKLLKWMNTFKSANASKPIGVIANCNTLPLTDKQLIERGMLFRNEPAGIERKVESAYKCKEGDWDFVVKCKNSVKEFKEVWRVRNSDVVKRFALRKWKGSDRFVSIECPKSTAAHPNRLFGHDVGSWRCRGTASTLYEFMTSDQIKIEPRQFPELQTAEFDPLDIELSGREVQLPTSYNGGGVNGGGGEPPIFDFDDPNDFGRMAKGEKGTKSDALQPTKKPSVEMCIDSEGHMKMSLSYGGTSISCSTKGSVTFSASDGSHGGRSVKWP